jgi:hypothetical protein
MVQTLANPQKLGIGTWDKDSFGTALNDVESHGFSWYYNWSALALWDVDLTPENTRFVPMIRDLSELDPVTLALAATSGSRTLLTFNEPDNINQANMSVDQALRSWRLLEATDLLLSAPATSQYDTLGPKSWLGRFMARAEQRDMQVDFIQVHYYSDDADVRAFRDFLKEVHDQYDKPIWVTEWSLADWNDEDRFSAREQAAFARAGTRMMDELSFVKKQAWFAAYEGGGGWHLNSGLHDEDGALTPVGRVFNSFLNASAPYASKMAQTTSAARAIEQSDTFHFERGVQHGSEHGSLEVALDLIDARLKHDETPPAGVEHHGPGGPDAAESYAWHPNEGVRHAEPDTFIF